VSLSHIGFVSYFFNDDIFHGLFLACAKNKGNNLSVIGHDQLVDEVYGLLVNVTGHHGVFQVLKAVVDVYAFFDVEWSSRI
jgi:hypothetical protein